MKLIAKAAKEVSVEIKQDQEAILKALGKSLKVIEKLYFHHCKIVTSIHFCSIDTISICNQKSRTEKYKTKSNIKAFRTDKNLHCQIQISIFPIPTLFTTLRKAKILKKKGRKVCNLL